ncbi:MAG: glycosyltransferase [Gemmataceae bacterium]
MSVEALTILLPMHNQAVALAGALPRWLEFAKTFDRPVEFIAILDGCSDDSVAILSEHPTIRVLTHANRQGIGAAIRTGLCAATTPLVAYVLMDYPYQPEDLALLVKRLDEACDVFGVMKKPDGASGIRTGLATPAVWSGIGRLYRGFCKVILGNPMPGPPSWLSWRDHSRAWLSWWVMGMPLTDPNCGLKAFRRDIFNRFPIQSDGDFVHAEIFCKLTFLGSLLAEDPLMPSDAPLPPFDWSDYKQVLRKPLFGAPVVAPQLT